MKPYYEADGITIYHGDCREVLPSLSADVVMTDPPYGVDLDTTRTARQPKRAKNGTLRTGRDHAPIEGDRELFDPSFLLSLPCCLFGANFYADRLPPGRWHVWDKTGGGIAPTGLNNEFEVVWTSYPSGRSRVFRVEWAGVRRINNHPDSFMHPAQKPTSLMALLIQDAPPGVILDPFMGSGSTLRAAKDLGRKAIGVEISEAYCEIAANRLAQGVLDLAS